MIEGSGSFNPYPPFNPNKVSPNVDYPTNGVFWKQMAPTYDIVHCYHCHRPIQLIHPVKE